MSVPLPDNGEDTKTAVTQVHQGIPQIPFDLFIHIKRQKKKNKNIFPLFTSRRFLFTDAFGNLVYEAADSLSSTPPSSSSTTSLHPLYVLLDACGNSLLSIFRSFDGASWKGFRGDDRKDEDLLLTVERALNSSNKIELNVLFNISEEKNSSFKIKGSCFWRSCTIYDDDNHVVAQTNLMYKLGLKKFFVTRSKFRVTVFPGFADFASIAVLVLIFLDGRK